HVESVTVFDSRRSHWVVRGPAGTRVGWDAEIVNEIPHQLIGWRSLEHADVASAGSVHFAPVPGGRGTEVRVVLRYEPPAGGPARRRRRAAVGRGAVAADRRGSPRAKADPADRGAPGAARRTAERARRRDARGVVPRQRSTGMERGTDVSER